MDKKNTVRSRIDWARKLPEKELLELMINEHSCANCEYEDNENCYGTCGQGLLPWWQEPVTYDQFREDVNLNG